MNFNSAPTVSLKATSAGFPFLTKHLSLPYKVRIQLEAQSSEAPSTSNGVFPTGSLSLSTPHAEIWIQGKQLLIRDRSSTYGTYINGIRIQEQTLLQDGDILTLGEQIARASAPANATDSQLCPIEATVKIVGA
ncbi:hypothetical protein JVU11DRAFT_7796 [Chiua virens]|nr:hypothetical protein JVU11DRAFT_7796 [Chiua virens]